MNAFLGILLLHGFISFKLSTSANTDDLPVTSNQTIYDSQSVNVTESFGDQNVSRTTEKSGITSPNSGDSIVTPSPAIIYRNVTTVPPTEVSSSTNVSISTDANVNTPTTGNDNVSTPTAVTEVQSTPPVDLSSAATSTTLTTTGTGTESLPTTAPPPLPSLDALSATVTDVSSLCPCNEQQGQCEVNCCCDPDCSAEMALFTHCSPHKVSGNPKLCSQNAAIFSIGTTPEGFAEVRASIQREVNPDLFCIYFTNNEAGFSHSIPEIPTPDNFQDLFTQAVPRRFSSEGGDPLSTQDQQTSPGYQFGDVMRTQEEDGNYGYLHLPGPAATSHCLDMNPAAFLKDQAFWCSRTFSLLDDCTSLPALNTHTYTHLQPLSGKNDNATVVAVEISSIIYRSLEGAESFLPLTDDLTLDPVLITSESEPTLCGNVVLQVGYVVTHSEAGEIVRVAVSLTVGVVSEDMLPLEQHFHISFIQEEAEMSVRYSGNPGYLVGLPLVAGSKTADGGIVRSSDPRGELTVVQGTSMEDCLSGPHQRHPVLFGVDVLSGCTLRLEETANCSQVSEVLLGVLRGQHSPQYVASFGNSQLHNPMDWLAIKREKITMEPQSCSIPLSFHLEVQWTNYGSLVNPQPQITSVKEVILTNTSSLDLLSGGSSVISVTSSVTFVPVSSQAVPGYRNPPTIDAKLPYGFFFPFV